MAHLTSFLAAGVAVAFVGDLFFAADAMDFRPALASTSDTRSASSPRAAEPMVNVNRSRKSGHATAVQARAATLTVVAKVEFTPNGAVLLRDRDGNVLFGIDPELRHTTAAKNAALPQLTIDGTAALKPAATPNLAKPIEAPEPQLHPSITAPQTVRSAIGGESKPERPRGCDPAFSPIAAPQLDHIFGRCVTALEMPVKLASVH